MCSAIQTLSLQRSMSTEAEEMFWCCPELLYCLLSYLDIYTTICFAQANKPLHKPNTQSQKPNTPHQIAISSSLQRHLQAHEPVDSVLGKTVWNKLINEVCRGRRRNSTRDYNGWGPEKELMQRKMEVVKFKLSDIWYPSGSILVLNDRTHDIKVMQ